MLGIRFLSEASLRTDPGFTGRAAVPALVDTCTGLVVSNDFPQLSLDLSTEWTAHHRPGAPQLVPPDPTRRSELDTLMEQVYRDVNDGVYRCGFATTQQAYHETYEALFARLDMLSGAGSPPAATCSAARSLRPTSGYSPAWSASTRSTTGISRATGASSPSCLCYGHMLVICTRRRGSAIRYPSTTSSGTTTGRTTG